jgi:hypothetical protein
MQQVYSLSKSMYYGAVDLATASRQARSLHEQVAARLAQASTAAAGALTSFNTKIQALIGEAPAGPDTLSGAGAGLAGVMNILQAADVPPTTVQLKAITTARTAAAAAMAKWTAIKTIDLPALNVKLSAAGLAPVNF